MANTTTQSPIYLDFLPQQKRMAKQTEFDQTVQKVFDGNVPNNIKNWVNFVSDFSYYDNPQTGEYAFIIELANLKNCKVEILKQKLDLEPHISIRRNCVAIDVGKNRHYVPLEHENISEILDIAIRIDSLYDALSKMPPEKAKNSHEAKMINHLTFSFYKMTTNTHNSLFSRMETNVSEQEREQALAKNLKTTLIKHKVLPQETTLKKYRVGKTLEEAYSTFKKIVDKISQKLECKHQPAEQTLEM